MIVHRPTHYEVWTATNTRAGDSNTWHGSYIELYPNGDMIAVQRNEAGAEDRFYIKRGDIQCT